MTIAIGCRSTTAKKTRYADRKLCGVGNCHGNLVDYDLQTEAAKVEMEFVAGADRWRTSFTASVSKEQKPGDSPDDLRSRALKELDDKVRQGIVDAERTARTRFNSHASSTAGDKVSQAAEAAVQKGDFAQADQSYVLCLMLAPGRCDTAADKYLYERYGIDKQELREGVRVTVSPPRPRELPRPPFKVPEAAWPCVPPLKAKTEEPPTSATYAFPGSSGSAAKCQ